MTCCCFVGMQVHVRSDIKEFQIKVYLNEKLQYFKVGLSRNKLNNDKVELKFLKLSLKGLLRKLGFDGCINVSLMLSVYLCKLQKTIFR